ncbi:MAG TPA: gluconate 2-dehydrogenase subunit 3 family protein [Gemmatimonadales bacterium]|nr:gluconate 2-dehydrogenase subunit 3 family protein [Gemmatimonadales bacterium]
MPDQTWSRRSFVRGMAGAIAAPWLAAALAPALMLGESNGATDGLGRHPAGTILTPAERRDLDAFAAQIIPTDGLPGAREANVVEFIDRALGSFADDQRPMFTQGLADLASRARTRSPGAQGFADLDDAAQIAVMRELESEKSEFFEAARAATIAGLLADPAYGGNANKIGWRLIGFEDRYAWQPPFGWYDDDANAHDASGAR